MRSLLPYLGPTLVLAVLLGFARASVAATFEEHVALGKASFRLATDQGDTSAAILLILSNRRDSDRVQIEGQSIILDLNFENVDNDLPERVSSQVAKPEKIDVPCHPMRLARPNRKDYRTVSQSYKSR